MSHGYKIDLLYTDGKTVTVDVASPLELAMLLVDKVYTLENLNEPDHVSFTVRVIPHDNMMDTDDNDIRVCILCEHRIDGMGVYVFRYPFFGSSDKMVRSEGELLHVECHQDVGNVHKMPPVNGSVSHGTMREEDLRTRFGDLVRQINPEVYNIQREMARRENWDSETRLQAYTDFLETCAPLNYYFGANQGDGADYGFWRHI